MVFQIFSLFGTNTGGIASTEKSSSEFVSLTQHSKIGPDLPGQYSFAHCMTKVDEDLVIITGGSSNNGHNDGETLLVNPNDNFTMTPGPRFGNKSSMYLWVWVSFDIKTFSFSKP